MKRKIYAIIGALVAVTVLALSGKMFEDADKSKNYVCQMPVTGEYSVWTEGGLQMQWFGDIDAYAKTSQIEFSDLEKNQTGYVAVGPNPAAGTTFNDRGKGYIVGSFRVVLPADDQNMMEIQRDFGSEQALINNLMYHDPSPELVQLLGNASYSLVTQVNGRGVYSFCMCPGGFVVNASSEENKLVINGMSNKDYIK